MVYTTTNSSKSIYYLIVYDDGINSSYTLLYTHVYHHHLRARSEPRYIGVIVLRDITQNISWFRTVKNNAGPRVISRTNNIDFLSGAK